MTLIDISVPLYTGMLHWPDNPPVEIEPAISIAQGGGANVSKISMGSHTGTHMDSPYHFLESGQSIDQMPLDTAIGPCRVVDTGDAPVVSPAQLGGLGLRPGERILFKTQNSRRHWETNPFREDYVGVGPDAARALAEAEIRLVGLDYLSMGPYGDRNAETHRTLLAAGVWIVEGLNLDGVEAGDYELICLPLRIRHGDGAPSRAILRTL